MPIQLNQCLGAYSPGLWRVFAYVASNYLEINSVSFASLNIVPGMGFWIIAMLNDVVTFRGSIAPGGVNYEMSIPSGWNLTALPWTSTNIDLGNIQVTDGVNAYGITSVDNNLTRDARGTIREMALITVTKSWIPAPIPFCAGRAISSRSSQQAG